MLLYLAFCATLNLCAGYVLGVYCGWLPWGEASLRREPKELADEEPLVQIAPMGTEEANVASQAAPEEVAEPIAEPEPALQAAAPADLPPAAPEPAPEPAQTKPSVADMMNGLAAFQNQLASLGQEMNDSSENAQEFDDCASRMQEANHAYLDKAQETIEQLDESDEQEKAAPVREVLVDGKERVGKLSEDFDAICDEPERDEETRSRMLDQSNLLTESTASLDELLQQSILAAGIDPNAPDPEPVVKEAPQPTFNVDPENGLATIDSLLSQIDELLNEDQPLLVATVRIDPLAEDYIDAGKGFEEQLLTQLGGLTGELIAVGQGVAIQEEANQVMLLLSGDNADQASRRMERIRQEVEAATFFTPDAELRATVTCAVAECVPGESREDLLEQIEETLAESERYGGNRCYHHDGKFPAPVVPEELTITPRKISI